MESLRIAVCQVIQMPTIESLPLDRPEIFSLPAFILLSKFRPKIENRQNIVTNNG